MSRRRRRAVTPLPSRCSRALRRVGCALRRQAAEEAACALPTSAAPAPLALQGPVVALASPIAAPIASPSGGISLGFVLGVSLGLSAVAAAGVGVTMLVLARRRDGEGHHAARAADAEEAVLGLEATVPDVAVLAGPAPRARPAIQAARLRSYTLPQMTTSNMAIRVATGGRAPTNVTLRVVGPAGAFGVFSTDAAELNIPGIGSTPVGETLLLATGGTERLRLEPGQPLYARGSAAGVIVSVTASEAVTRVTT